MKERTSLQQFARHLPLTGSIVGMILILGSLSFPFESDAGRIGAATGGILALLGAVWYSANPFIRNTRRYLLLRAEVIRFIGLARDLNAAVVHGASGSEIEAARARLRASVERIVAAAGKTQPPGKPSDTMELFVPAQTSKR